VPSHRRELPWFGPRLTNGGAEFHLWAPSAGEIALNVDGREPVTMLPGEGGGHEASTICETGARYEFRIDGNLPIPDPASRAHDGYGAGASVFVDPKSYQWECTSWRGRPWEETILYKLHVGLVMSPRRADLGRSARAPDAGHHRSLDTI